MAEKTIVNDSPRKKKKGDVVEFKSKGTYYFTVHKDLTVNHKTIKKRVLVGQFLSVGEHKNDSAPEGCCLDTTYCMKSARVTLDMLLSEHPQNREYLDFLDYKGEHLREILAMNKDTRLLCDLINNPDRSRANAETVLDCSIIEPLYESFDEAVFDTPKKKLLCMLQIVDGLYDLTSTKFSAINSIIAHRDLKFSNLVIENAQSEPKIKLIDFSTIKTDFTLSDYNRISKGALSPSNTAPEDVMPQYTVSEKNDVFALGIMLAELFGIWKDDDNKNPLSMLFDNAGVDLSDTEAVAEFYRELIDASGYGKSPCWLENALTKIADCSADWSAEFILTGIKQLFEGATRLLPADRISLKEFEAGLLALMKKTGEEDESEPNSFSVFFISTDGFGENRDRYIKTACEIMKSKNISPVIIEYSSKSGIVINKKDISLSLKDSEYIRDTVSLKRCLRSFAPSPSGYSELIGALYAVYEKLFVIGGTSAFNGEFHIFTKALPTNENSCVLHFDNDKTLDVQSFCASHSEIDIIFHT